MQLVTDRPRALNKNIALMGVVKDGLRNFACMFNASTGDMYIEEMFWTMNVKGNEATANLRLIESTEEWNTIYAFITTKTTIFSPKKLRNVIKTMGHRNVVIDEVIKHENFPYAKRNVDESKVHRVTVNYPKV